MYFYKENTPNITNNESKTINFNLVLILVKNCMCSEKKSCHTVDEPEYNQSKDPYWKQRIHEIEIFTQKKLSGIQTKFIEK